MPFKQVEAIRQAAVHLMQQSIQRLMQAGMSGPDAEELVKRNFENLNLSGEMITIEALCENNWRR